MYPNQKLSKRHPIFVNGNSQNPFILGCWNFSPGYWKGLSTALRNRILKEALSLSLFEWDSATSYSNSEQFLSQSIFQLKKETFLSSEEALKIKINSKTILKKDFSIVKDLEKSLSRLKQDSLGCYFIHWPLPHYSAALAVEQLHFCKETGKIQEVGISNFSLPQIEEAEKGGKIDILQTAGNLLWREGFDSFIPYCQQKKIALQFYSPLAQGILTDRSPFFTGFSYNDGRASHLCFLQEPLRSQLAPIVAKMKTIALPLSLAEASLLWLMQKYPEAKILLGVSAKEQLTQNYNTLKKQALFSKRQYESLEALSVEAWRTVKKHFPDSSNIFNHQCR